MSSSAVQSMQIYRSREMDLNLIILLGYLNIVGHIFLNNRKSCEGFNRISMVDLKSCSKPSAECVIRETVRNVIRFD